MAKEEGIPMEGIVMKALANTQFVVKLDADDTKEMRISVRKAGPITAAMIEADPAITVINKDLVLATLTEDVPFEMSFIVGMGRGAILADHGKPRVMKNPAWLAQQARRLSKKYESYWYSTGKGEWTKNAGWPTQPEQWKKLKGWVIRKKLKPSAATPAQARAREAATSASSPSGTWEMRRSFMPVRLTIHSSSVLRKVARSALVSTAGGRHLPQPVMAACFIGILGVGGRAR